MLVFELNWNVSQEMDTKLNINVTVYIQDHLRSHGNRHCV
jgi:hypothetical protein